MVGEYFEDHSMPNADWAGWHPQVPDAAIQIKSIQGGINGVSDNIHRFGFFPSQAKEVKHRFPDLPGIPETMWDSTIETKSWFKSILSSFRKNSLSLGTGPQIDSFRADFYDDRSSDTYAFINDIR